MIHPGIVHTPLPVLVAPPGRVDAVVQAAAAQNGLFFVSFSSLAQACRTYEEYVDKMAVTSTTRLANVGVGLYGPRKQVTKLVGSLPLLR